MSEPARVSGVVLNEDDYLELYGQAQEHQRFLDEVEMLCVARSAQHDQLEYWLGGGHEEKQRQQEEREEEWLAMVRQNPNLAWRVKGR